MPVAQGVKAVRHAEVEAEIRLVQHADGPVIPQGRKPRDPRREAVQIGVGDGHALWIPGAAGCEDDIGDPVIVGLFRFTGEPLQLRQAAADRPGNVRGDIADDQRRLCQRRDLPQPGGRRERPHRHVGPPRGQAGHDGRHGADAFGAEQDHRPRPLPPEAVGVPLRQRRQLGVGEGSLPRDAGGPVRVLPRRPPDPVKRRHF